MVGDAWALLTLKEKEAYKAKAHLQARERRGSLSAGEAQPKVKSQIQAQQRPKHQKPQQRTRPSLLRSATPSSRPVYQPHADGGISDEGLASL
jgi:hypothetical protein